MMLNPPLTARNGRVLQVIVVCRISTEHQDERSLQDQEALYRKWLAKYWDGEIEVVVLASQGSGESLVRDDYFRLSALVSTRPRSYLLRNVRRRLNSLHRVERPC